ncbi:MAG: HAMP domain-containing histidine kinase [Deltaproteobacteria bacterium]|nr:HAMP domain-containing histidine kinase [Deltaproteobacteria bacterium]
MEGGRFRLVYLILVPAILVAAGILGYYTFLSAREHTQLGEQTIAQSLLSVAQQRVQRIERYIDIADHAVFRLVDPNDSSTIDTVWLPQAATQTPSVRSVLLIDQDGNLIQWASRQDKKSRRAFLRLFRQKLVKALELDSPEPHLLRHAHEQIDGKDYLLSYKAYATLAGQLTYIVAHHDTQFLVDEVFPMMFVTDETTPLYDIVDESNQLVFGPDLSEAGMYTVYHKFPTTLYRWRLQVAPQQAALLQAQGRSRMQGEVALPLMSFAIILLSAIFFIYAAEKERRLNQLKSELMANVSHELKTPLSVVRMFADMLRSGRVPSEERKVEYLDIICRESERLTSLIDNMLDFSALEGGQGPYRLKRGNIGDAVDRALDAFRYRSEQDGVEIHLERPNDLPPVMIDQEAIALAIINLLDNTHLAACSNDSIVGPIPTQPGARASACRWSRTSRGPMVGGHGPKTPAEAAQSLGSQFPSPRGTQPAERGVFAAPLECGYRREDVR